MISRRGWFIWLGRPCDDADLRYVWIYLLEEKGSTSAAFHIGHTAALFLAGALLGSVLWGLS